MSNIGVFLKLSFLLTNLRLRKISNLKYSLRARPALQIPDDIINNRLESSQCHIDVKETNYDHLSP